MSLPWFRMYAEFATDPVVQCLAFDDQRHFLMLLCFKCSGLLDRPFATHQQRIDVIRKSLGLDGKAWDEMRQRLVQVNLVDEELQPLNWNKRQYLSDADPTATERQRRRRERMRHGRVTRDSRAPERESDSESDSEERESLSLPEFRIPECPKDMDQVLEHQACVEYHTERGQVPTRSLWRSWVLRAVKSGVYAKRGSRPPTEEEIRATRRELVARMEADEQEPKQGRGH